MIHSKKLIRSAVLVSLGWAASGCLSMQSQSTIDNIQQSATKSLPYVEAYVEYRGPAEKWAGPTTFLLHVVAKDAGVARISITPALFNSRIKDDAPTTAGRGLASRGMPGETARDHMARLASAVQGGDEPFRGCLSPVRVRLVRADGALVEKSGCRSETGWPRAASEAVNSFIVSTVGTGA